MTDEEAISYIDNNNINNLSEEEQLKVIKFTRFLDIEDSLIKMLAISYIKTPSEKVQLETVKINGYSVRYLKNPSKEVQLEAIKQSPQILNDINEYIKTPCQEVLDLLMIKDIIE